MRWKGFITLTVIFAVMFIFGLFFLDDVIETAIEKGGTAAWGAKVEIDKVNINWSPLGIEILKLTAASKKEEYKNLIDIGSLKFSVLAEPLFGKKLIIKETTGKGLAFNTDRETSGFLPRQIREKKKEIEKKWHNKMASWLEDIKKRGRESIDVTDAFKKEDLKSLKAIEEVEEQFNGLKDKYKEVKGLDVNKTIQLFSEKIKALEGIKIKDEQDIPQAANKISEAQNAAKEADKVRNNLQKMIGEFGSSTDGLKDKIREIEKARKEDYRDIMNKLKLPSIEVDDIAETVFGPLLAGRFIFCI